ncbi:hypothetical protein [Streptomyces sp. NPDC054961]
MLRLLPAQGLRPTAPRPDVDPDRPDGRTRAAGEAAAAPLSVAGRQPLSVAGRQRLGVAGRQRLGRGAVGLKRVAVPPMLP